VDYVNSQLSSKLLDQFLGGLLGMEWSEKSFGYKLIGPKMIQLIISFLSLKLCSWAKLLLFHAAQPLQTYQLQPCFIYVALGQQLPRPNRGWDHGSWQQAQGRGFLSLTLDSSTVL